jgi:hypothetical protein
MEPNLNILLQDLMKQVCEEIVKQSREEIVANFTVHSDPSTSEWKTWRWWTRSVTGCVTGIESAVMAFDKWFAAWKPEVDKLLTSVKLKLSKLNSFFDRDAKLSSASKPACYRSSRRSGVVMRDPAPTALMGTTLISATGIVGLGRDSPKS